MVLLILAFSNYPALSEQPPDQRGLDNRGCTVARFSDAAIVDVMHRYRCIVDVMHQK